MNYKRPGTEFSIYGLHTAWRRAQNRSDWRTFVRTAMLQ